MIELFTPKDMPIITDNNFWIVKHNKKYPFIWTQIVRSEKDIDDKGKFNEVEKLPEGIRIEKHFVSEHLPTAFVFFSMKEKYLKKHLKQ